VDHAVLMSDLEGFQQIAPEFARAVDRQGPGLLEPALNGAPAR